MKKILLFLILLPSLAQALSIESADGWPGVIGMETIPATTTLRQAMELRPVDIPLFPKNRGRNPSVKHEALGINYLLRGNIPEALIAFKEAERTSELKLTIDHNLAVAYELAGDNGKALDHVRNNRRYYRKRKQPTEMNSVVLLAKIQAQKTGQPFTGRLLEIPENVGPDDLIQIDDDSYPADMVKKVMFPQLMERLLFVKAPDPYAAELLYSYALLEANLGSARSALDVLKIAREYGFSDQALLETQQVHFQKLALAATIRFTALTLLVIVASLFLLYYGHRKKWHVYLTDKSKQYWSTQREIRPLSSHQFEGRDRF